MRTIDIIPNWIYRNLGCDGLLHIIVTALVFKLFSPLGLALACFITIAVGIAKEAYDAKTGGKFDARDLICDSLGIVLALIIMI